MNVPAWFARSVFRAQEAAMHRPTFAMLAELERTQWLSHDAMRGYQTGRLNALLQSALAHRSADLCHCQRALKSSQ